MSESRPNAREVRVGIDVGGTFTDAVLWDSEREDLVLAKVPSTPPHFADGVMAAAREVLEKAGLDGSQITHLVHSSTVAANVVNEKKGAKVGLLTTQGFRDVLEIQRVRRDVLYNLGWARPQPLVPRELRHEVLERVDATGTVIVELDEEAARASIRHLIAEGCTAFAVTLLFSFLNASHERRIGELIAEEMPAAYISLSSTVNPEFREYERSSTTVIDAYVKPEVTAYYLDLQARFVSDLHFQGRLDIIQSAGGAMSVREAARRPSQTVESGAASGAIAAAYFAREAGLSNAIAFDMGGTTGKATLIQNGVLTTKNILMVDRLPVRTAVIDLLEISGGGGTIAWADDTGLLRLGPGSAGATPGPVCYGRGGTEPTLSDANALLGYYPDRILGGRMALDLDGARRAVHHKLSAPLGLTDEEVALGILRIANAAMEGAIRVVSTQRGVDLRESVLIPFGGAGPVHACMLAQALGIPRVLVPPAPGNVNAFGALVADSRYDFGASFSRDLDALDLTDLEAQFEALRDEAAASLTDISGAGADALEFRRLLDMRYKGQGYELTVPIPWAAGEAGADWREALEEAFHAAHRSTFTFDSPGAAIEMVSARFVVSRPGAELTMRDHRLLRGDEDVDAPTVRLARFPGTDEKVPVDVYQRHLIPVGTVFSGPAIVEEYSSTVVIPPNSRFHVDEHGHLDIELNEGTK
jgi:N-methylhydantoinase A